jgi:Uma2 family endonuclease
MATALDEPAVRERAVPVSRAAFRVQQEQPLGLESSEPEPDISIVDTEALESITHHAGFAHLIVEISNITLRLDRVKGRIYARAKIPRYLLINLNDRQVEEFLLPDGESYRETKVYPFGRIKLWQGIEFDLSGY